jgi:spermidine synthase
MSVQSKLGLTRRIAYASALFFISGFAALVYQVIWQRILGIFSGVHIYSITIIVSAFMAGLGVGSLLGGRFADRISRERAIIAFGICELCIGFFALASPWIYYDVAYLRAGGLIRYPVAVPAIHFALLILPTFLMGASLPLLCRGLVENLERAPRTIAVLYGVNALGAALGAFVSVWFMVGAFGFSGTVRLVAWLNFAAAGGAFFLLRAAPRSVGSTAAASAAEGGLRDGPAAGGTGGGSVQARPLGLGTWAAVYGTSGFIALSLEILWFRILSVTIQSGSYTFGHLLAVFLLFLGLGGLVGGLVAQRVRRADLMFLWGQWGIAVSAAVSIVLLCHISSDSWFLEGMYRHWARPDGFGLAEIVAAWNQFVGWPPPTILVRTFQIYVLLPLLLMALPTFLMGLTYAFIQRSVQTDLAVVGWRVGVIQTANIIGSFLGSLITGALFLTVLGTPTSLRLLILAASSFGCLAVVRTAMPGRPVALSAVVACSVVLAWAIPGRDSFWARFHGSHPDSVLVAEDASSVIALQRFGDDQASMRVNGSGVTILPYGGIWTLMGLIPVLAHPEPADVLVIGLGAGNTAWAAGIAPDVKSINVYEIAKPELEVLKRSQELWFSDPAVDQLLDDPRLDLTFSDGRLAMRMDDRKYDLIEADALQPEMAYSGNLYSKEFFELVRASLKPGGIFCSFAPTARTLRTVSSVFPHVLHIESDIGHFLLASDDYLSLQPEALKESFESDGVRRYLRD